MDTLNAMLLQFENPIELFAELLVFIGIYVQRENFHSFLLDLGEVLAAAGAEKLWNTQGQ